MSRSLSATFTDEVFWYTIGVDYDEAENKASDEETNVESLPDALLNQFVKRKRPIILEDYESIDHFKEIIKEDEDPESELLRIFAEVEWFRKSDGVQFESEEEVVKIISEIADNNAVVKDTVNEEFEILWPGNNEILREIDEESGQIEADKHLQASPIVIKKTGEGFEVRGTGKRSSQIIGTFRERDDLIEETPEAISESVIDRFGDLLGGDNEFFKITGLKLSHTDLPRQSQLTIKSDDAVYADLSELRRKEIVSFDGVSELHTLYLQDKKLGNKFRIRVKQGEEGFRFVLKALNSKDYQREEFKNSFSQLTGIEFGKIYEYSSQDERYLFNRILTGSETAYQKYLSVLDETIRNKLESFTDAREREVRSCTEDGCGTLVDADDNKCTNCGSELLSSQFTKLIVEINLEEISNEVESVLTDLTPRYEGLNIGDWKLQSKEMGVRPVIESKFNKIDLTSGGRITNEELYFVPQGSDQRPSRINEYLLDAVYVTYGGATAKSYEGYGQVSLYDLLFSDEPAKHVGRAILETGNGLRDRLRPRAKEAQAQGEKYFEILKRYGPIQNAKDHLESVYDPSKPNYFEKHVFYLLKDMFVLSERWGKEGKRLSDGALICSQPDSSDYYVASYDAKLSHRKDGYPLSTELEDQATRYIMTNRDRSRIENKTDDRGPYAHIFISQNLRRSQYSKAAENIRENQDLFSGEANTEIVYMEYESLLELHNVYIEYWSELQDGRISSAFLESFIHELQNKETGEEYIHFNLESVSEVRTAIVERLDGFPDGSILPYSEQ